MKSRINTSFRLIFLPLIVIFILSIFLSSCESKTNPLTIHADEFSVHILNVGEGDSILINFPDGKNMLIDTGNTDDVIADYVKSCIKKSDDKHLDYLVITHPDSDHVGNAKDIATAFSVGTVFGPYIHNLEVFPLYNEALTMLKDGGCAVKVSQYGQKIEGEDYLLAFLSPSPLGMDNSSYNDLNASSFPSSSEINDASPIIYLEYKGVRFVFTGDAGVSQENLVINNYKLGIYDMLYGDGVIKLENVDVLKVSHHGSGDATSKTWVELLTPKNAVISVGDNSYGHPSSATLERIQRYSPEVNFLRTDINGTISMRIGEDLSLKIG